MTFTPGDRLLDAWLSLTSTLWNTRIVSSMSFNECHVLGILLRGKDDAQPQTATGLIARTHLLKSQMNKVLTTLEGKGFITRMRAAHDRRLMYIHLTPAGEAAYLQEHEHIDAVLKKVVSRIGEEQALDVSAQLKRITGVLDEILAE